MGNNRYRHHLITAIDGFSLLFIGLVALSLAGDVRGIIVSDVAPFGLISVSQDALPQYIGYTPIVLLFVLSTADYISANLEDRSRNVVLNVLERVTFGFRALYLFTTFFVTLSWVQSPNVDNLEPYTILLGIGTSSLTFGLNYIRRLYRQNSTQVNDS